MLGKDHTCKWISETLGFRGGSAVKSLPATQETWVWSESGRSPEGGCGNPLQHSCLENPMDRGAWRATVHRLAKGRTRLKQLSMCQTRGSSAEERLRAFDRLQSPLSFQDGGNQYWTHISQAYLTKEHSYIGQLGLPYKIPQTEWLRQLTFVSYSLESKIKVLARLALGRSLLLPCRRLPSHCALAWTFCAYMQRETARAHKSSSVSFSFYKDVSPAGLGSYAFSFI